ncbi:hypothetical protein GCM10022225_32070 [Plantactinospora mayteni]|uniref:Copper resistance protein D domain-containing protein n=1 Tax=Plantactinospora mayteni TaxID=566021 RepID=A0ABQ4ELY6_9ACTN|nr:hypothetical protein [Plantactinospora mayteni]GIG95629.1 hypothetical protein Pma05_22020 [Plantactinospora mayteni]
MDALPIGIVLVHAGVAALWLGSMAYSLFVVQPKLTRMFDDPERVEDAQRVLAHGNRWPVVGLVGVLWATGLALVLLAPERTAGWWAVVAGKAVLLAAATGLFCWVSWRGWPRRVFALPAELPGLTRRFRRVAVLMLALVATAYALGILTTHADST